MLDTRQYRNDQPCGDGTDIDCAAKRSTPIARSRAASRSGGCSGDSTLAGAVERDRPAGILAQRDFEAGAPKRLSMDGWDGYAASRDRLLGHVARRKIENVVVLTGDVHAN